MTDMQPLDLRTLDLHGLNLIEASAGTGKTFSIAALYLRLVLGIGRAPLPVENILVVTFTRAAVAELRGRVRQRLVEARQLFQHGVTDDAFEQFLLAEIPQKQATALLDRALTSLDNAAIFTIHGFCQRLLREYALDLGAPLEAEFIEDESRLTEQAVADVWRSNVYAGSTLRDGLLRTFETPQGLHEALRPVLRSPRPQLEPAVSVERYLKQLREYDALLEDLRLAWQTHGPVVSKHLQTACADKVFEGRKLQWRWLQPALRQLDEWAAGQRQTPVARDSSGKLQSGRLFPESLYAAARDERRVDVPNHDVLALLPEIVEREAQAPALARAALLAEMRDQVLTRVHQLKGLSGARGMDDLLGDVAGALAGPLGEMLAHQVSERYPVALVDEFQDTDPLQYDIFRRVYYQRDGAALFMIGDPKQAIYRFRGADIHAYLAAARDCDPGRRFTLGTNWRSSTPMVAAVNKLFVEHDDPFLIDGIGFHVVEAAAKADKTPLHTTARRAALTLVLADPEQAGLANNKGDAQHWQASWIAGEISQLLRQAVAGEAQLGERPLQAGDIAVLVRGHNEARQVRLALAEHGLGCVYRGRQSVFATALAGDLEQLLAALVEPENELLVRSALGTALVGIDPGALYQRFNTPAQWQRTLEDFRELGDLWRSQGVLPALYRLFGQEQLLVRLRASDEGERHVTDLLHLCELLQQAAGAQGGPRELLHWYARQRQQQLEDDTRQLRLESEDNLVKVVTIHTSKGLQYPVTFVAGMWNAPSRAGRDISYYDADTGAPCLAMDAESLLDESRVTELRQASRREQLGEDMRLLYVALTRSVHRCYVMLAPVGKGLADAAVHHLLGLGAEATGADDYRARLAELRDNDTLDWTDEPPAAGWAAPAPATAPPLAARVFSGQIADHWRLTSYTGLTRELEHPQAEHFEPAEIAAPQPATATHTIHNFPRGAAAGICLHGIFERLDCRAGNNAPAAMIAAQLARHGFDEAWVPVLQQMVAHTLAAPLADGEPRLMDAQATAIEMEFMLPLGTLNAAALEQAIDILPASQPRPALHFRDVAGMLRGFIDLVFRANGRFYVADYKSNWLGHSAEDYHAGALDAAMAEHRYDVQAMLYAVALHRHLRRTLPDYDPAQHFGGVGYLFLRGIQPEGGGIWFHRPSPALLACLDQLLGQP
ncbi:exodeoxyribonuclease V subunit beta [Alcanivorax quisquiliarum]|uniref:RecBCD enzyme subunit RecB n=1 Tax=Alcanivorax quisquiliarum TaxID=2933565 RepID=A0ABT0E4Q6_9GAMM|nr:exodeoxyribonuclease V subunit beta [Alcanivorax quisquiliarum]MCK0536771.1 exodeoxyribonuclease V subunit beta [Alcanivorax quisquiliarum]